MNNFQDMLQSQIAELNRVAEIVCNSEKVSRLDLDVLLDKLRASYDVVLNFDDKEQLAAPKPQIVEQKPQPIEKVVVQETKPIEEPKPQVKIEPKEESKINLEPKQEAKPTPVINKVVEKPVEPKIEPKIFEAPKPVETKQTPIIPETKIEKQREVINQIEQVKKELLESQHIEQKEEPSVLQYLNKQMPKTTPTVANEPQTQKTIAETYQTQKSVFENMAQKEEQRDVATSFAQQDKMDLRSAIGVNEKFMFINDLFSGNLKEYMDFIQKLNSSKTLLEATCVIDEMKKEKHWVPNALPFTTLQEIVAKKYN